MPCSQVFLIEQLFFLTLVGNPAGELSEEAGCAFAVFELVDYEIDFLTKK